MAESKKKRVAKNYKRVARVASHGVAGSIVGTYVGAAYGHPRTGGHVGAGVGTAVGSWREGRRAARARESLPATTATTGGEDFKKRVGTKTNGRVGEKDNPYM